MGGERELKRDVRDLACAVRWLGRWEGWGKEGLPC